MSQTHTFKFAMTCEGCANAARRVLGKVDGVENIDISVEQQTVKVTSAQPAEVLLAALQKTGKETSLVS